MICYYNDDALQDDDWACIDDDLALIDSDDSVCDIDGLDGLFPEELDELRAEEARALMARQELIRILDYEGYYNFIHPVPYQR